MKRSTWIILLVFLAVIGILLYFKYRPAPAETTEEATPTATIAATRYLFNEDSSSLTSIRIYDKQYHIVLLERPAGGLWIVTLPTPNPASQAEAEAGATQITALVILDTMSPSVSPDVLGLEFPLYTIKLNFQTTGQHKLEVGNMTPTGNGYYVRYDDGPIYIIDVDGIDSILNLLTTPPYLPTETPVPTEVINTPTP